MKEDLASIAQAISRQVQEDNVKRDQIRTEQHEAQWSNAAKAYNTFLGMVESYGDKVKSYKIGHSSLVGKTPAAIITDTRGRTFEIHHDPRGLGDLKYHINGQWLQESWHRYSVALNARSVAEKFGRWMVQD